MPVLVVSFVEFAYWLNIFLSKYFHFGETRIKKLINNFRTFLSTSFDHLCSDAINASIHIERPSLYAFYV